MKRTHAIVLATTLALLPLTAAVGLPPNGASSAPVRQRSELRAIAGTSADDIWAVGNSGKSDQSVWSSYVRHFDGHTWKTVSSPYVGGGSLNSVAAIAPDDAWAVGSSDFGVLNLAEHWDGKGWSRVTVPNGPGTYNYLGSVSYLSPTYVLAVGLSNADPDPPIPVTLLWDGTKWSEAPASLDGVSYIDALSPTDAWAVGTTASGRTLAKHWDGTKWHRVDTPNLATPNTLTRVEAISPHDVWATGQVNGFHPQVFFEHWDGKKWRIVENDLPSAMTVVSGIGASSRRDVWTTGYDYVGAAAFLEHWDGSSWSEVENPARELSESWLYGVATFAANDAWAVGRYTACPKPEFCYDKPIIQRWDGHTWTTYHRP